MPSYSSCGRRRPSYSSCGRRPAILQQLWAPAKGTVKHAAVIRTEPSGELRILSSWRRLRVAIPGLSSHLLAFELLSQLTFDAFLFSGLHVVGVFLDFLDNAFLLNLSLEAPKGALNGLTFEHPNFRQSMPPQYV